MATRKVAAKKTGKGKPGKGKSVLAIGVMPSMGLPPGRVPKLPGMGPGGPVGRRKARRY